MFQEYRARVAHILNIVVAIADVEPLRHDYVFLLQTQQRLARTHFAEWLDVRALVPA